MCYPIIVRSATNVVLGPKVFSEYERGLLSTENGGAGQPTTLSIFEDIDMKTRNCELTWAGDDDGSTWLEDSNQVKQGLYLEQYDEDTHINWPLGSQVYSYIRTYVDDKVHGFELSYHFDE